MFRFRCRTSPEVVLVALIVPVVLATLARAEDDESGENAVEEVDDPPEVPVYADDANEIDNRFLTTDQERRETDESYLQPILPPMSGRRSFVESLAYFTKPRNPFTPITTILPIWSLDSRFPFFARRAVPLNRQTARTYAHYPPSSGSISTSGKRGFSMGKRAMLKGRPVSYSQRRTDTEDEQYPAEWNSCIDWVLNNLRVCKVASALKSLQVNLQKRNTLMKKAYETGHIDKKPTTMTVVLLLTAVDEALRRMNDNLKNMIRSKPDAEEEKVTEDEDVDPMAVEEPAEEEEVEPIETTDDMEPLDVDPNVAAETDAIAIDQDDAAEDNAELMSMETDNAQPMDDLESLKDDEDESDLTGKRRNKAKKKMDKTVAVETRRKAGNKRRQSQNRAAKGRRKKNNPKAPTYRNFVDENVELQGMGSETSVFKEDFGNRIFVDDVQQDYAPTKSNSEPGSVVPNIRGDFARRTTKSSRRNAKQAKPVRPARKDSPKSSETTSTVAPAKSKRRSAGKSPMTKRQSSTTPVTKAAESPVVAENRMFPENITLSALLDKPTTDSANRTAV